MSLRATADTRPLPAGPRISPFSSANINQEVQVKIISSKKCRWTLTPWYRLPSGHDLETRWKLPSHLPHKRRYRRYALLLLALQHLKSLCSLTRSGFSRAETINKISIPFKASTTSGVLAYTILRISADALIFARSGLRARWTEAIPSYRQD